MATKSRWALPTLQLLQLLNLFLKTDSNRIPSQSMLPLLFEPRSSPNLGLTPFLHGKESFRLQVIH
jgi:hypothetical protein